MNQKINVIILIECTHRKLTIQQFRP